VSDGTGLITVADAIRSLQQRSHAVVELNQYSPGATPDRMVQLPVGALPTFAESAAEAVAELAELSRRCRTTVCCQNAGEVQRLQELLGEFAAAAPVTVVEQYVHRGFLWETDDDGVAVVPYHELLHRYQVRRRVRHVAGRVADRRVELEIDDYVVHRDHGIAQFRGLQRLEKGGTSRWSSPAP
jgi:transcription-repair coupling factor (superfamily II helicase)